MTDSTIPAVTVVAPGAGEVIGDAPHRRVEILCEEDALHATWVRIAAGGEGADLHVHRRHSDLFYVLAGELTVRLGAEGEPVAVPAGTLARIPPLVVHGYRNASAAEVRFLNLHAPGTGFAPYLRALRDGRPHAFDQEPPGADARPATEASVGGGAVVVDRPGRRVTLLADEDAVAIAEVALEAGARPPDVRPGALHAAYVLEGALGVGRAEAPVGTWVTFPPGVSPALRASAPVRHLTISAPGPG